MKFNELLVEMSILCSKIDGFGFSARINSNDHNPPHVHITTYDDKKICKLKITEKKPETVSDLKFFDIKDEKSLSKIKRKVLDWTNTTKQGVDMWRVMKITWELYHPLEKVKFE